MWMVIGLFALLGALLFQRQSLSVLVREGRLPASSHHLLSPFSALLLTSRLPVEPPLRARVFAVVSAIFWAVALLSVVFVGAEKMPLK